MTDNPPLRSTLLGVAGLVFPQAVKRLADHQEYLIRAQTIGASKQDAERILTEVMTERATTCTPGDPYRTAYRRLSDAQCGIQPPPEDVRRLARQMLQVEGAADDPDSVDRRARHLLDLCRDWAP